MQKILTRDFDLSFFAQFAFLSVFYILIPTISIHLSNLEVKEAEIGVLVGALFAPPFSPFLAVRVLQGIGLAFFSIASLTFVANIIPETNRGQIVSYYYLSINFALALAPYFEMLLINRLDFPFNFMVLFLACPGLSLCYLFITLKLKKMSGFPKGNLSSEKQPFLSWEVLPPGIMAFLITITWGDLTAFFPLYALRKGVDNPGLFFAAFAITLLLVRVLGGKTLDIYSRKKVIFPAPSILSFRYRSLPSLAPYRCLFLLHSYGKLGASFFIVPCWLI